MENIGTRMVVQRSLLTLSNAIGEGADAAKQVPAAESHVNVAHRTNVQVATHIGQEGANEHADATQTAPIKLNMVNVHSDHHSLRMGDGERVIETRRDDMTEEKKELTPEEIAQEGGEALPDREEMSLVNANVAAPVNLAAALNVLSDNSTANATATQTAPITQGNG